jgi:hypothetical protein
MRSLRPIFLALAALALACSGGTPVEGDPDPSPSSIAPLVTETVLADAITAVAPDPYVLESVRVRDDSLHVRVRFAGGCRTHEFRLVLFKTFRESYPVQSDALLAHAANGDSCRALLVRDMSFDLTPLRDHYRRSYLTASGVIHLRLLPPGEGTVEYRF